MNNHTDFLADRAKSIQFTDDDLENELREVVKSFKTFDKALDSFLLENSYAGDINNVESKIDFLSRKFISAGIRIPRDIKKWYLEQKQIDRDTAFTLCFAFDLNQSQTDDFFRRVYQDRSFDLHSIKEAIYFYCITNHLTFQDAEELIDKAPKDSKGQIHPEKEVLYTGAILEEIQNCKRVDELLSFFQKNIYQFGYNNVTATKYIQKLWEEITNPDGLLKKETAINTDNSALRPQDASSDKELSATNVYLSILGLNEDDFLRIPSDRSLKPFLDNNDLMHRQAAECFPERLGIGLVLKGKHVSYNRVRKLLILLLFYSYWAEIATKRKREPYRAVEGDSERCIDRMDHYLMDVGYPELYYGNPYDWIFLWVMQDEFPLMKFRYYMYELLAYKSEEIPPESLANT